MRVEFVKRPVYDPPELSQVSAFVTPQMKHRISKIQIQKRRAYCFPNSKGDVIRNLCTTKYNSYYNGYSELLQMKDTEVS